MADRRNFLKQSAALAVPLIVSPTVFGAEAPSERINVGFIGNGNQGMSMLKRFLNRDLGNILAVCDVNQGSFGYKDANHFYGREPASKLVNEFVAKKLKSGTSNQCKAYADFRDILKRDDIDAVIIIVPDHWHKIIAIMAMESGKDVYCENR